MVLDQNQTKTNQIKPRSRKTITCLPNVTSYSTNSQLKSVYKELLPQQQHKEASYQQWCYIQFTVFYCGIPCGLVVWNC